MEKTFKFQVEWHKDPVMGPCQMYRIFAQYPTFVYAISASQMRGMSPYEQQRFAIAELKVKLIQEIANATFEEIK